MGSDNINVPGLSVPLIYARLMVLSDGGTPPIGTLTMLTAVFLQRDWACKGIDCRHRIGTHILVNSQTGFKPRLLIYRTGLEAKSCCNLMDLTIQSPLETLNRELYMYKSLVAPRRLLGSLYTRQSNIVHHAYYQAGSLGNHSAATGCCR